MIFTVGTFLKEGSHVIETLLRSVVKTGGRYKLLAAGMTVFFTKGKNIMKKIFLLMLAALLLLVMISCNKENETAENETADTQGESATVADTLPDETLSELMTTQDPDGQATEVPVETQEETVAETQAPEPQVMSHISFDDAVKKGLDITDYLTRPSQASAEAVVDGETSVLSLKAAKKTDAQSSDPYIHLNYEKLAKAMGGLIVDTTEYPYLVLRVKGVDLWSRTFSLYGYATSRVQGEGVIGEQKARLKNTDEWQYIRFDLTGTSDPLVAFRFDFVNATVTEDTVLISDLYFCKTEDEAVAMTGPDTYPIKEQTMDDYILNVMSFNVQTENGTSVRMDIRADMLRDLIDEYMPDSIGMQEVTVRWRELMDNYIFNDSYTGVGVARTDNPALGLEQSCIFYRSDKYDLLDSGTFWLSDTPDVVGSAFETSQYPRICTYVHLKDKVTGFEYIHMNTHLDHDGNNSASEGRAIRLAQAEVMLKKLHSMNANVAVVITGDFNQRAVNPSTGNVFPLYKLLTGERNLTLDDGTEVTFDLADSRMHAPDNMPEDFTATMTKYHDKNNSGYNPARGPIDYCFYTPEKLEALSYAIRLFDRNGIFLSDHLPVITSFRVVTDTAE